jgi:hypothetical protein
MKDGEHGHAEVLGEKISARRAEQLILDWVNLKDCDVEQGSDAVNRLIRRYPEVFPDPPKEFPPGLYGELLRQKHSEPPYLQSAYDHLLTVAEVLPWLKRVWNSSDLRKKRWFNFKARDAYWEQRRDYASEAQWSLANRQAGIPSEHPDPDDAPPQTAFEIAMAHLLDVVARTRCCPNSECPAPYFLATKTRQVYCSPVCAGPRLRESKRNWWKKHRSESSRA